ncbi:MAG TPA: glycosyltransferase family 87 protein, partial [Candidatus Saccharimonadales bacterium]|nr:glycosyltransferase family 87 protein [Candidatus Saccharimonadales bacterium]
MLRALPLLVLALLGLVHVWQTAYEGMGIDFFQFWSVGQAVREHLVDDVYAPDAGPRLAKIFLERAREGGRRHQAAATFRRDEIQTSNTPFLYTVFYAFESGDYETDIGRFRLLGLLVAVLSVVTLCRRAGYSIAGTLAALVFVLWAFVPLHYDLREGNVNSVQLGAMALYLLLAGGQAPPWRRVAGGAALALGVAFKPNLLFVPLVLAMAWVIRREWKDLALKASGMALGALAAIVASAAFFGSVTPWLSWADTLRHINETFGSSVKWGSFGGGRLLADLTGRSLSPVLYLITLGAVAFAIWKARSGSPSAGEARTAALGEFAVLGVGPLVPLIAADLAWPHYLVQ